MEDVQVDHIGVAITTMKITGEVQLKEQTTEGFNEVTTRLNSLFNSILERVPKENMVWKEVDIHIGKRARIVYISPRAVETPSEDIDMTLQQFEIIALDINKLLTHTLVRMQILVSQEIVDQEQIVGNHIKKFQEKQATTKKDIEELKKEKNRLTVEKV